MHAFCIFYKIRIGEIYETVLSEMIHLFPLDQTIACIGKNKSHNRSSLPKCCLIFLAVHHKSAISRDRKHFFILIDKFGRNSAGNCDSHSCKTV